MSFALLDVHVPCLNLALHTLVCWPTCHPVNKISGYRPTTTTIICSLICHRLYLTTVTFLWRAIPRISIITLQFPGRPLGISLLLLILRDKHHLATSVRVFSNIADVNRQQDLMYKQSYVWNNISQVNPEAWNLRFYITWHDKNLRATFGSSKWQ